MTLNLQQAKRLNELGVRKKAQFVWFTVYADNKYWDKILYEGKLTEDDIAASETIYPAYNAEELISMIKNPVMISIDNGRVIMRSDNHQQNTYFGRNKPTLTEALGNKLIHDLESGAVAAEDVNK